MRLHGSARRQSANSIGTWPRSAVGKMPRLSGKEMVGFHWHKSHGIRATLESLNLLRAEYETRHYSFPTHRPPHRATSHLDAIRQCGRCTAALARGELIRLAKV